MSIEISMRTALYHKNGNPSEVVVIENQDKTSLQSNQIRVMLELASVNPADLFIIMGSYPLQAPFPRYPGSEGVGIVSEVGRDVTNIKVNDRVLIPILAGVSVWSEEIIVDKNKAFLVPHDAKGSLEQIAMASVNPTSAYGMLTQFVTLKEGDWIIQNAANSAVGSCVIGFARDMGVKTVNVVRRPEVIESVKQVGGDIVILDGPDLSKRLKSEHGTLNIKLALDGVAGESTHQLSQCLKSGSTVVTYGAMSMKKCELGVSQLIFRQIKLFGYWYHLWTQTVSQDKVMELNQITNAAVFDGKINVQIHKIFPLEDIQNGLKEALLPKLNGKILISGPAYKG